MIHTFMYEQIQREFDRVLRGILRQLLDREPVAEDAKELTLLSWKDSPLYWRVVYKGHSVGCIHMTFEGAKFTITFTPYAKD